MDPRALYFFLWVFAVALGSISCGYLLSSFFLSYLSSHSMDEREAKGESHHRVREWR